MMACQNFSKFERKQSFNGQYFQTSQISDIWFNENALYKQNLIIQWNEVATSTVRNFNNT